MANLRKLAILAGGVLDASRSGISMGNAGYRLNADVVEAYSKKS